MLDSTLDIASARGVSLVDEWLDLSIGLGWSQPAGLWCFPIETVSQSESGFEGVYQSSAVIPHWIVAGDESRRWEVRIRWTLDRPATLLGPETEATVAEGAASE
jgi:alpha-amylase